MWDFTLELVVMMAMTMMAMRLTKMMAMTMTMAMVAMMMTMAMTIAAARRAGSREAGGRRPFVPMAAGGSLLPTVWRGDGDDEGWRAGDVRRAGGRAAGGAVQAAGGRRPGRVVAGGRQSFAEGLAKGGRPLNVSSPTWSNLDLDFGPV